MGHNLNFNENTQQHSFFSVKEKAWHGLGKIVDQYPTSAEALVFAGLDFEVVKDDLFTTTYNMDGQAMDQRNLVRTHHATIRKDTGDILGIVGKDYEIVQNKDAFAFFDAIVGGDGIQYETAGALGKGERVFITAKLPGYIRVGKEDLTEKYLFLSTSHDGYGSIMAAFTPVRIVCNNTLNAAMRDHTHAVKIRHTPNAKQRLEHAHKLMGISNNLSTALEELFNHWSKLPVTDAQVKRLVQMALVPNKEALTKLQQGSDDEVSTYYRNMCNTAFEYAIGDATQQLETTRGTLYGVYNGITGYFQNVRKFKDDTAKVRSILYQGMAQQRSQFAFDLCTSFSENSNMLN
jgi:phage/plasmid-like protein (TIGR03299 family)